MINFKLYNSNLECFLPLNNLNFFTLIKGQEKKNENAKRNYLNLWPKQAPKKEN